MNNTKALLSLEECNIIKTTMTPTLVILLLYRIKNNLLFLYPLCFGHSEDTNFLAGFVKKSGIIEL